MSTGQDYPDWQSYANWRGPDLNSSPTWELSSSNPFVAQGYVTNYASITIDVGVAGAAGLEVVLAWYNDASLALFLGYQTWQVAAGQQLYTITPTLGNYLKCTISGTNTTPYSIALAVLPCSNPISTPAYPISSQIIQALSTAVSAGASLIVPYPFVQEGNCTAFFNDVTNSGKFTVQLVTLTLAGVRNAILYSNSGSFGQVTVTLQAPAVPLGLNIANSDTVSHQIGYYMGIGNP